MFGPSKKPMTKPKNVDTLPIVCAVKTLEGHTSDVTSVAFSPNNQYVVSGSEDKTIRLWNVETGECIYFSNK